MSLKKYSLLLLAFTALGIDSVYCADMYRNEIDRLNAERRAILARSGGEEYIYERASERDLDRFLKIKAQLSEAQNSLKSVQASHAGKGGAASAAVPAAARATAAPVSVGKHALSETHLALLLEERRRLLRGRNPEDLTTREIPLYVGIMQQLGDATSHGAAVHGAGDGHGGGATAAPTPAHVAVPAAARATAASASAPVVAEFNVYDAVKVNMLTAAYMRILRADENDHIRDFEGAATIVAKERLPSVQLLLAEMAGQGSAVTATEIVGFLQSIMEWN